MHVRVVPAHNHQHGVNVFLITGSRTAHRRKQGEGEDDKGKIRDGEGRQRVRAVGVRKQIILQIV